jgi:hypothetical protein
LPFVVVLELYSPFFIGSWLSVSSCHYRLEDFARLEEEEQRTFLPPVFFYYFVGFVGILAGLTLAYFFGNFAFFSLGKSYCRSRDGCNLREADFHKPNYKVP